MGRLCLELSCDLVDACARLQLGEKQLLRESNATVEIVKNDTWIQLLILSEDIERLVKCTRPSEYAVFVRGCCSSAPPISTEDSAHQLNEPIGQQEGKDKADVYECNVCDATFHTLSVLRTHISTSHPNHDQYVRSCLRLEEACKTPPPTPSSPEVMSPPEVESNFDAYDAHDKRESLQMDKLAKSANHTNLQHADKRIVKNRDNTSIRGLTALKPKPKVSASNSKLKVKIAQRKLLKPTNRTDNMYPCGKCGKSFKELYYLRHHVKRKHKDAVEMLTEIETKRALARKQMLKERKQDLVACPVCKLGFQKHAKGVLAHITKVHPKYDISDFLSKLKTLEPAKKHALDKDSGGAGDTESALCNVEDVGGAENMGGESTADAMVTCSLCSKRFVDSVILFHVENAHSDAPNIEQVLEKYRTLLEDRSKQLAEKQARDALSKQCMFCGKSCKKIVQHMRRCRSNPDSIQTKQCACGFRVKTQEALAEHKARCKLNSCTFLCDLCGLEFSSKSNMYYHRRSKHGICGKNRKLTICPCPECGKVFPAPSRLRKHMTVHTGQRDYICETCGKDFKISEHLRHHVVTKHLGRYRYHCDKCGHGINKRQKLKTHKCDRVRRLTGAEIGDVAQKKALARQAEAALQAQVKQQTRAQRQTQQTQLISIHPSNQALQSLVQTQQALQPANQQQPMLHTVKPEIYTSDNLNSVLYQPAVGDVTSVKPETLVYDAAPIHAEQAVRAEDVKSAVGTLISTDQSAHGMLNQVRPLVQPLVTAISADPGTSAATFDYFTGLSTIAPAGIFEAQQFRIAVDGTYQFNPEDS